MAETMSNPLLYQINTRVWLRALSKRLGRAVDLNTIPDAELDRLAEQGFDWVWLLSVWQTGAAGRAVSRTHRQWREGFQRLLPDLTDEDICGSGFAITEYTVSKALGGDRALAHLRQRLADRGLKLMLDFVPNHTAPDHAWARARPDYFVAGSADDLARAPQNYLQVETDHGPRILAYGRDPYFDGWPDTLQLNYGNPDLRAERIAELLKIAGQCDGVRCDMAMLIEPEVFARTWGIAMEPFWPGAIERVRQAVPGFVFMAEVYWDMEWTLQQQGFDYCYDKRLYDRLRDRYAPSLRGHLVAGLDYQSKLARFLENHDEPRAAATFPPAVHQAAAIVTFLAPGLRFFHQGQLEGYHHNNPPHLCRGPDEPTDAEIAAFYRRLLDVLKDPTLRRGAWSQLDPLPAWAGNGSNDGFVASLWQGADSARLLVVVNYADIPGQCRLKLPLGDLAGRTVVLTDRMGTESYQRHGDELLDPGLFIQLPPWRYNIFAIEIGD